MVEEEGKKEEQFGFTPEGEALGYISSDQARLMAMEMARGKPSPPCRLNPAGKVGMGRLGWLKRFSRFLRKKGW